MRYSIHKNIENEVEFWGLKSHFLVIGIVGLFIIFLGITALLMMNVPTLIVIILSSGLLSSFIFGLYYVNNNIGIKGFTKFAARKTQPSFIISRKPIRKILKK